MTEETEKTMLALYMQRVEASIRQGVEKAWRQEEPKIREAIASRMKPSDVDEHLQIMHGVFGIGFLSGWLIRDSGKTPRDVMDARNANC